MLSKAHGRGIYFLLILPPHHFGYTKNTYVSIKIYILDFFCLILLLYLINLLLLQPLPPFIFLPPLLPPPFHPVHPSRLVFLFPFV